MLLEQRPQVLAHVASPVENPIQEPRPIPERLPAQGPLAFIVDACPFKLMALDFDFSVIKKHLRLPGVQPPPRLGLLAGPVHKLRVDAVQVHHTLFGLGTQPLAQRGLIKDWGGIPKSPKLILPPGSQRRWVGGCRSRPASSSYMD